MTTAFYRVSGFGASHTSGDAADLAINMSDTIAANTTAGEYTAADMSLLLSMIAPGEHIDFFGYTIERIGAHTHFNF